MKLNEIVQPASQFMTDHDQIEVWLKTHNIRNYSIHPNGIVDVDGDVRLSGYKLKSIPVQFGRVSDDFWCDANKLISLAGCPYWVGSAFSLNINNIKSLSGIHKLVKHIGHIFGCDRHVTNILGLMLIDGLRMVNIDSQEGPISTIMNQHLQGDRDIHKCQENLIEAGFGAQAKL